MFSNNHYCKTLLFLKKKGTEEWEKKKKKETFLLVSLHPVPRQNEQEVEEERVSQIFFSSHYILARLSSHHIHTCFNLESYFNGGILKFFTLLLWGNIKKLYSADLHLRLTWSDSLLQMFFSSAVLLSIRLALRSYMAFFCCGWPYTTFTFVKHAICMRGEETRRRIFDPNGISKSESSRMMASVAQWICYREAKNEDFI